MQIRKTASLKVCFRWWFTSVFCLLLKGFLEPKTFFVWHNLHFKECLNGFCQSLYKKISRQNVLYFSKFDPFQSEIVRIHITHSRDQKTYHKLIFEKSQRLLWSRTTLHLFSFCPDDFYFFNFVCKYCSNDLLIPKCVVCAVGVSHLGLWCPCHFVLPFKGCCVYWGRAS